MPVIGAAFTMIPSSVFFMGYLQVLIALCQNFANGGSGKNGSTVAVRKTKFRSRLLQILTNCFFIIDVLYLLKHHIFIIHSFIAKNEVFIVSGVIPGGLMVLCVCLTTVSDHFNANENSLFQY